MSDEAIRIPPEHEVRVIDLPFEPGVTTTPGGVILASLGSASDDPDRELAEVLAGVDRELAGPDRMVEVVAADGRIHFVNLFAPAQPETRRLRSPITWCFHAGSVASVMASPTRRDLLVERMHRIAGSSRLQSARVLDGVTPAVVAFTQVLQGLAIGARKPDPSQGGCAVHIEVKRPGGEILCILAGEAPGGEQVPDRFAAGELIALGPAALAEQLRQTTGTEVPFSYRSPRLRQIMIDGANSSDGSGRMLHELLSRPLPVFIMTAPSSTTLEVRKFGEQRALAIYSDATAVQWAALDTNKPKGSFEPTPVRFVTALVQAARGGVGLAVGLYRDRKTPMYAVVDAPVVAGLVKELQRSHG